MYFENRELVYHYKRVWIESATYEDIEWAHVWRGMDVIPVPVNEVQLQFFLDNKIVEETSGNEHDSNYQLTEYYRIYMKRIITEKDKEAWEKRKNQKALK